MGSRTRRNNLIPFRWRFGGNDCYCLRFSTTVPFRESNVCCSQGEVEFSWTCHDDAANWNALKWKEIEGLNSKSMNIIEKLYKNQRNRKNVILKKKFGIFDKTRNIDGKFSRIFKGEQFYFHNICNNFSRSVLTRTKNVGQPRSSRGLPINFKSKYKRPRKKRANAKCVNWIHWIDRVEKTGKSYGFFTTLLFMLVKICWAKNHWRWHQAESVCCFCLFCFKYGKTFNHKTISQAVRKDQLSKKNSRHFFFCAELVRVQFLQFA